MSAKVMLPFFSVGVTTYNRADLVSGAIQSVLAQSFTDYELIIVDDASTDRTPEVVKQFSGENVRYFRQSLNHGIAHSRNEVIKQARGEFIIFLDDDDQLGWDFLTHVYTNLQSAPDSVAFAIPGRHILRPSKSGDILIREINFGFESATILSGRDFIRETRGGGSGLIVRSAASNKVGGFRTDLPIGEDIDFMLRLARQWDCLIIPEAILRVYNLPRPQITQNRMAIGVAFERLGDLHIDTFSSFPQSRAVYYRYAARIFYSLKEYKEGRRCIWKAIRIVPWSYKVWQQFALLELSDFLPGSLRKRLFRITRHDY